MLHTIAFRILLMLALVAGLVACAPPAGSDTRLPSHVGLPPEALATLALIQRGGPFPYRKDGTTFQNRERLLPTKPRGFYREYTVPTPGLSHRGARRIVTGGQPPREWYSTADHYESFRRFQPPAAGTMQ